MRARQGQSPPLLALATATLALAALLTACDGVQPPAPPPARPAAAPQPASPSTSTSTPAPAPTPTQVLERVAPQAAPPLELPAAGADPFSHQRLQAQALPSGPPPAPLAAASLATMEFVGSVFSDDQGVALLRLQGRIYTVRVGDRLGPEQSRVSRITPTGLELRQSVRNTAGQLSAQTLRWRLGQAHE